MEGLCSKERVVAQGRRTGLVVCLTPEERRKLETWQRSRTIRTGLQRRSRVVLLLADGRSVSEAARAVGMRRKFVYLWVGRFVEHRLAGLSDEPGRGRKPFFPSGGGDPPRQDRL
jgi:transposase-like protein